MRNSVSPDSRSYTSTSPPPSTNSSSAFPPMRRNDRQQQQQQYSLPPAPQYHSSTATSSGYAIAMAQYPHHPASTAAPPPQGYVDSFTGIPIMAMGIDAGALDHLGLLSAEEHRDVHILERRSDAKRQRREQSHDSTENDTPRSTTKKQRGRPRLDPKDENAADRRRTQIRLAQRAYRLRKETTISSLRTRVTDLESAIEGLQSTFLELHETALEAAQKHDQRDLFHASIRSIADRFLTLSRTALGPDRDHPETESDSGGPRRPRSRDDNSGGPTSGGGGNSGSMLPLPTWGGYQISYSRSDDGYNGSTGSTTSRSYDSSSYYMEHLYPSPPLLTRELTAPYYATDRSFHRRLHRASLENAYRLFTSPSASETEVARTFAYTFCYATRQDCINTVTRLLRAGPDESLSPQDYPELGKTLPRRPLSEVDDILSAYLDKARSEILGETSIRAEAHRQLIKLGVKNKFLGPMDVENLLVEKGILESGYLSPPEGEDGGSRKQVDLDVLVKELVPRGVCLGQFPGFKREDVEDCLRIAERMGQVTVF